MTDPDLHNRLERLADVARAAYAESNERGSVADPASPQARAAVAELQAAVVAAGFSRRHAEWAVTRWIITGRPVLECVAATDENGPRHP